MAFLCIWVDPKPFVAFSESWWSWSQRVNVPGVHVEYFQATTEHGTVIGQWQWRWLSLLASLARINVSCPWNLLIQESTYVFLPAVVERLTCLGAEEAVMLGHLQGRYEDRFPMLSSIPHPLLSLPAGLFVSSGWLQQEAVPKLDTEICDAYAFEMMTEKLRDRLVVGSSFSAGDHALSLCLAAARFRNPPANFGFPLEHYVVGDRALERLVFRARYAGAWGLNQSEIDAGVAYITGSEPACVLVASPVHPKDFARAEEAALALWTRGCTARHLVQIFHPLGTALEVEMRPDRAGVYGNTFVDDSSVHSVYDRDRGNHLEQQVFSEWVKTKLANCQVSAIQRNTKIQSPALAAVPSFPPVLVFLGLPGGASSWLADILEKAGARGRIPDLLHPYLHEHVRAEMSMLLGAAEDMSYVNIFRSGDHIALSYLINWILHEPEHSDLQPKFAKEIINVARVTDLQKLGFQHLLAFYRPRRYTFPVSDLGTVAGELCRSCYYKLMLGSFILQPCTHPVLRLVRPTILALIQDAENSGKDASGVIVHTVLWYLILSSGVPVLHYVTLMTETSANIAAAFDSASSGFNSSLAQRLAEEVISTRQSSEWLHLREQRYNALHVEYAARILISELRRADPYTDLSTLEND